MKTLIILSVILLSGCSSLSVDDIRDERFSEGCKVIIAGATGKWVNGHVTTCRLMCTENLPENYKYSYRSNICNVSISN